MPNLVRLNKVVDGREFAWNPRGKWYETTTGRLVLVKPLSDDRWVWQVEVPSLEKCGDVAFSGPGSEGWAFSRAVQYAN